MMAMVGSIAVRAEAFDSLGDYSITEGPADRTLLEYAKQAREAGVGVSVLFRSDVLSQFNTNAVQGRYRADDALDMLLRDTGLAGSISAQGVVIINKTDTGEMAMKKSSRFGWLSGLLGFASAQMTAPLTGTAYAQAPAQPAAEELALEEVVITGSRIQRPGFESPTPVTSLDATVLEQAAQVNIANVLNDIPAFRPTVTETSAAQVNNTVGANFADLRGLGAARTLVLLNGQRIVPQAAVGGSSNVDMNIFPSIAIQRVDVVTGGASSAWGSDAVAGVVNLQMYRRYDGLKTDLQYGISSRDDNEGYAAQFLAGTSFGERAHVVVAGAWSKNDGVGDQSSRPWWGGNWPHIMRDATRPGCANRPATNSCWLAGDQWQLVTAAPGGVINGARLPGSAPGVLGTTVNANTFNNSPLNNVAFGVGGAPYMLPQGYFRSGTDGIFGGSVPGNYDGYLVPLKAPSRRTNLYANFDFDFTDNLTGYVTLNYSDRHARNFTNTMIINYDIFSGNPYIPASIQSQMTALGYGAIRIGVKHNDVLTPPEGVNGTQINGETKRVSAGFDWRLGDSWKLDGYAAYSDNHTQNFARGQRNFANARLASDVILVGGVPQCRNPANGCVPINIFGVGSPSAAALDFITSDQEQRVNMYQRVVALNLSGEPFNTWAGPVSIATGIEYRKESKKDLYDPLTKAGQLNNAGTPTLDFAGELDVKEGYAEAAIPLVSDAPGIRSLDLNGAFRATDYSTMGRVNTWKAGVLWKVIDPLLFRATVSRDIRAPTINDLLAPVNRTSGTQISGQATPVDVFSGGNPNLKSEIANGMLFGITYRPSASFGVTVDYYDLEIEDVIFNAGAQQIANACAASNAVACGQVFRDDPTNPSRITRIVSGNSNVAELIVKGIDAEVFSTFELGRIPGSINLRAQGTYADTLAYRTTADQPLKDYAGQNARGINDNSPYWAPRFKGSLSVGYNLEGFSGNVVGNYLSSGVNQVGIPLSDFAQNEIPAYWKFDLNLSYRFGADDQFQVYANVRNLMDKEPPFAPNFAIDIPTSALYDTVGRTFVFGFRYSL